MKDDQVEDDPFSFHREKDVRICFSSSANFVNVLYHSYLSIALSLAQSML